MKFLKNFFAAIARFFTSGKAQADLKAVEDMVIKAMPYIDTAAEIVAGVTPTAVDNAALTAVHMTFPKLFDGSIKTPDELNLYALGVATTLIEKAFPNVSTSVARAAAQLAFLSKKDA